MLQTKGDLVMYILRSTVQTVEVSFESYQTWARLWSWDWDWDLGGLSLGLKPWDHLFKVSVSVSILETKVKSLSISLKLWYHQPKVSVSVSKNKYWSRTPKIFSMIYLWSSTTWLPYFFQISYIWPNLSTQSLSYQVLMCIIDTTYSKSQYQSQFLRPKWVSVSVSTFETNVKSLGLSRNLWDHSKKCQSQSRLLIPTTKSLSCFNFFMALLIHNNWMCPKL